MKISSINIQILTVVVKSEVWNYVSGRHKTFWGWTNWFIRHGQRVVESVMSKVQPLGEVDTGGWRDFATFVTVVKHLRRGKITSDPFSWLLQHSRVCCYRAESTRCPNEACGLDDSVDTAVQLHLSIYTAHRSLFGRNDRHLRLPIIDQCVKDGLDVVHRQVHLQISQERACQQGAEPVMLIRKS